MTTQDRKYPHLDANFLKGSVAGQIKSIHRTRETPPEKLADFQRSPSRLGLYDMGRQSSPVVRGYL
jgi:hypothetical protein